MTPPAATPTDLRTATPTAPWGAPRVTHVAVARPQLQLDPAAPGAVEWLPRSTADRRL